MRETKQQKAERFMKIYKCSFEEAYQLVLDDEETDRGVLHEWNLTKAQEKELRKVRQADREVKSQPKEKNENEKPKRTKKSDDDKKFLIEELAGFLNTIENVDKVEIKNEQGKIEFYYKDRNLRIVLSAPRK